jgi:hypothetical protein
MSMAVKNTTSTKSQPSQPVKRTQPTPPPKPKATNPTPKADRFEPSAELSAERNGNSARGNLLTSSLQNAHHTVPKPKADPKQEAAALAKDAQKRVDSRTGFFGLDESRLGSDLAAMSATENGIKAGTATLDAVNKTNRDDVSSQVVNKLSADQLQALAERPGGKEYLQKMIGHMNSGHVSDFEGKQIAKAGPFAYDKHGPLMNDELKPEVSDAVQNAGATHQKLADGAGPVKFDEHSVVIDKMPPNMTPEQFLKKFAKDPNGMVDDKAFDRINQFERRSKVGEPKPGDIYDIDILGPDNGDVVLKEVAPDHIDVATLNTERHGEHPEYGTRRFGFEKNDDGSTTFYTRGVSRNAETMGDNGLAIRMGGKLQDYDWSRLVTGIGNHIDKLGGQQRPDSVSKVIGPQ